MKASPDGFLLIASNETPISAAIFSSFSRVPGFAGINCVPGGYVFPLSVNEFFNQ